MRSSGFFHSAQLAFFNNFEPGVERPLPPRSTNLVEGLDTDIGQTRWPQT
ncbi:hypothetical protein [Streptomyces sp. NPDC001970]